jgi:hypothetical protein
MLPGQQGSTTSGGAGIIPRVGNEQFSLDLPGTMPPQPKDVLSVIARADADATVRKHTSAVMSQIGRVTITATPTGGIIPDIDHNFAYQDDGSGNPVWLEAQRNQASGAAVNEYNIRGTVYNLNLHGMSYAQIGLVTYFCYDYAMNLSENSPHSEYMFNQNLYMLLYFDDGTASGNPTGYYARMSDLNGMASPAVGPLPAGGGGVSFDFQIRLNPLANTPVVQWSTPAGGPYTDHNCGDATLTIWPEGANWTTGSELFATMFQTYGSDNWGWRTAAGPELYDLANGGCAMLGQVYAANQGSGSLLEFDATLFSGPPRSDERDWWYAAGRDIRHRSTELLRGPYIPTVLWTYTPAATANTISSPVLDQLGNIYYGTNSGIQGVTPLGAALPGWPVDVGRDYQLSTPHMSVTYNPMGSSGWMYCAYRSASRYVQAYTPAGGVQWVYHVQPASGTVYLGITEANSHVYCSQAAPNNHFVTLDANTGLVTHDYNAPAALSPIGITNPAVAENGHVYITGDTSVLAFDQTGNFLYSYDVGDDCRNSTVAIAPDGALFVTDVNHVLHSLVDTGAALMHNGGGAGLPGFYAPFGYKNGVASQGIPAIFGTETSYVIYTFDDLHSEMVATSNSGAELWRRALPAAPAGAFAVGADGIIYVAMQNATNTVQALNPANGTPLWGTPLALGSPAVVGPALGPESGDNDGRHTLYVATANGRLHAINGQMPKYYIDTTSLANSRFTLYDASTHLPVNASTVNLDTDTVHEVTSVLAPGRQYYIEFNLDPAHPTDQAIYPANPGGTDTIGVSLSGFSPQGQQATYFNTSAVPGGYVLQLKTGAYSRIMWDMTSFPYAMYDVYVRETGSATFTHICGPLPNEVSSRDITPPTYTAHTEVIRSDTEFYPGFQERSYPTAGSDSSHNGSREIIYPKQFPGYCRVSSMGTLWTNVNSVIGDDNDLFDYMNLSVNAGMAGVDPRVVVLTFEDDAFCRCEAEPGLTLTSSYALRDVLAGTWIIPPVPGLSVNAAPYNTFAFARGMIFRMSNGVQSSGNIVVDANKLLNTASAYPTGAPPFDPTWHSAPAQMGATRINFDVLPVRISDDPREPNPGAAGTLTPAPGGWQVELGFVLQYGADAALTPYTVEVDTDYNGTWDSAPAGRVHQLTGHAYNAPGWYTDTVVVDSTEQPAGSYTFALKVTDGAGDEYIYPYDAMHGGTPVVISAISGAQWPMSGYDAQHTSLSPFVGPQTNRVWWKSGSNGN